MNEKNVLFVGLPGTGKTTFLAALWQLVDSQVEKKALELLSLKGDQEYLNSIRESWLSYTPVLRTSLKEGMSKRAEMKLINTVTQEKINLIIPDLSGEFFESAIEERQWSEEFNSLIAKSTGIVLFITPKSINTPNFISHAQQLEQIFACDIQLDSIGAIEESVEIITWKHEMIPAQVKIVDLLQVILDQRNSNYTCKLAIVISAWDLIEVSEDTKINPVSWIEMNLPMLYQYIICNKDIIKTDFFGISAQGSDYESGDIEKLYDKMDPTERIIVKVDSQYSHDISLPILWVTDQL